MLIDLSKVFDTINIELLIANFAAYVFSKDSLEAILIYLPNHDQCVKVNAAFSSCPELVLGVDDDYQKDYIYVIIEYFSCPFKEKHFPFMF